ncbi:hypothetical protein CYMTET_21841 [Cymbomonas tetramitiformis]|uniref:Transaldolase n=1 Tax=Cymbomonas tetramitiformis TaxID=36881 RepID=A0AAE0L2R9_9CHLO|nr:hypothetical protein CYMTET_21841 [Cymbomonas tetramitiformis]
MEGCDCAHLVVCLGKSFHKVDIRLRLFDFDTTDSRFDMAALFNCNALGKCPTPTLLKQRSRISVASSSRCFAGHRGTSRTSSVAFVCAAGNQLEQLSDMTTLSVDTGDLSLIEEFAATGCITDATTNPLLVAQAGLRGDATYVAFVEEAVSYAKENASGDDAVALAMDRLAVNLGREIVKIVPGYVSTEVDPRLSFDTEETVFRGKRIIDMYETAGVDRSRVLIKVAGTWEGIMAMEQLEKEGIHCNVTLVFGFTQAVASAQRGAHLISPFTGRILDWHKAKTGQEVWEPEEDAGVVECARMYNYFKKYGHDTICMPASWRPSRGPGYDLDEIRALAGADRMTIPPQFLNQLRDSTEELPRVLDVESGAAACTDDEVGGGKMDEKLFRFMLNADGCTTVKMAEGICSFVSETEKLEEAIRASL